MQPRGTRGFRWDKIFQPEDYKKTLAEMMPEEKNEISHRRKALNKLKEFLG
ncbi:MAG: non-canonical purine NTP pyrophosphatase [Candidatus Woesearchaeota archaeon]